MASLALVHVWTNKFFLSQTILDIMETIGAKCPNLKKLVFEHAWMTLLKNVSAEVPIKQLDLFRKLTTFGIRFTGKEFPNLYKNAEYLQTYLIAKCPLIERTLLGRSSAAWLSDSDEPHAYFLNIEIVSENGKEGIDFWRIANQKDKHMYVDLLNEIDCVT